MPAVYKPPSLWVCHRSPVDQGRDAEPGVPPRLRSRPDALSCAPSPRAVPPPSSGVCWALPLRIPPGPALPAGSLGLPAGGRMQHCQAWPCRQRGAPGKVPGPGVRKGRRGPDLQRVTGESTRAASGSCPGSPYPLGTLVAAVTPPHPILLPLPWNRLGGTVPRGRHGVQGPGQVRVVPGGKSPESTLGVGGC